MGDVENFLAGLPHYMKGSYGTNTSCVQIRDHGGDELIVFDAGSGIRDLGTSLMDEGNMPYTINIFMSHLHWDHIQGWPFFTPAYIPGNKIIFWGVHDCIEMALNHQQKQPVFPVPMSIMGSDIEFRTIDAGKSYKIAGFDITPFKQNHPGDSYGYRCVKDGKVVVYSTDCEHKKEASYEGYEFIDHFKDADVLIFDAQYDFLDAVESKVDWGHSNNLIAVELAVRSGVKRLVLFHAEHTADDAMLDQHHQGALEYLKSYAEDYKLDIYQGYDSLALEI